MRFPNTARRITLRSTLAVLALASAAAACDRRPATTSPPAIDDASARAPAHADAGDIAGVCAAAEPIAAHRRRAVPLAEASTSSSGAAVGFAAIGESRDSIEDLRALARAHQYEELIEHLDDIAPASRTAAWEGLVREAGRAQIEAAGAGGDGFEAFGAFARADALLHRYPLLAKDEPFMTSRGKLGATIFEQCFGLSWSGEECVRVARDFVAVEGTDAATQLAIAKLVRRHQYAYFAVPFFRSAVAASTRACNDDDLALSIEAGLGLPPDDDNARTARAIAKDSCFEQLRPGLETRLRAESSETYFARNTCAVLRAHGVVH